MQLKEKQSYKFLLGKIRQNLINQDVMHQTIICSAWRRYLRHNLRHSKALVFVFDVKPEGPPGGEELLAHVALVPVATLHVVLDLGLAREPRRAGLAADDRRFPGVASVAWFFCGKCAKTLDQVTFARTPIFHFSHQVSIAENYLTNPSNFSFLTTLKVIFNLWIDPKNQSY